MRLELNISNKRHSAAKLQNDAYSKESTFTELRGLFSTGRHADST